MSQAIDLQFDQQAVTQKGIAARCGVAQSTVSRVLSGDARIPAETAALVLDAARELGYDPAVHDIARRLVSRRRGQRVRTSQVAALFPVMPFEHGFFRPMLHGAYEVLSEARYSLLLTPVLEKDAGADQGILPVALRRGDIDGTLVCFADSRLLEVLNRLHPLNQHFPTVAMISEVSEAPVVQTDDRQGEYAAIKHLLELGHRHILHLTHIKERMLQEPRFSGALQAYQEKGLDMTNYLHYLPYPEGWLAPETLRQKYFHNGDLIHSGEQIVLDYLTAHAEITAIVGMNDATALHTWYALNRAGFRVPDDYSLVGFDDTDPMLDEHGHNLLTSVRRPLVEVGRAAARLLLQRIEGRGMPAEETVLPTELIVRASTGTPRGGGK